MRPQVGPKGVQGTECKVEDKKPSYGKGGKTTVTSTMSGGGGGGNGGCVLRPMPEGQAGDPNDEDPHRLWQRMTLAADNWELPHAADHLSHFLSGMGEPLDDIDVDALLLDLPALSAAFRGKLEALRAQAAQRIASGDTNVRFESSPLDELVVVPSSSPDWHLALGAFAASVTAETQVQIGDDGEEQFVLLGTLQITGVYGGPAETLTIACQTFTAAEFVTLSELGCARPFLFTGRSSAQTLAINGPEQDLATLDEIRGILDKTWVHHWREARLVELWQSFGSRMFEVAAAHPTLWEQSYERGARLDLIPEVVALEQTFRNDVRAFAKQTLAANEDAVLAEMMALGIEDDGSVVPENSPISKDAQNDYLAGLQTLAEQIAVMRDIQDKLKHIPVGYEHMIVPNAFFPQTFAAVVYFDPTAPPQLPPDNAWASSQRGSSEEFRAWEEVKTQYDALELSIVQIVGNSPALYQAATEGGDSLMTLAGGDPESARKIVGTALSKSLENIRATQPKIDDGDLDDRDLTPIHAQFFAGAAASSGTAWSTYGNQWAAQVMLENHESQEFWLSLGLSSLAAAGFVVSAFATGGMSVLAFAAGMAIEGGMVLASWENTEDLLTAAHADAGQGSLVSDEQAKAALIQSSIDTALLFIGTASELRALSKTSQALKQADEVGEALVRHSDELGALGDDVVRHADEFSVEDAATRQLGDVAEGAVTPVSRAGATGFDTVPVIKEALEANNLDDLLERYVGRELDIVGRPDGYRIVDRNGRRWLFRERADDTLFARLTVDADGIIRLGSAQSQRLSNSYQVAQSVKRLYKRLGLPSRPANHEAHHLIPDELVRKHPLLRAAYERGILKLDGVDNIALLARRDLPEEKLVAGLSEGLPRHQGPHPNYTKQLTDRADATMKDVLDGRMLKDLSDEELAMAVDAVLDDAWALLRELGEHEVLK